MGKKTQILDFARLRMSMVLRPDLKTQVLIFFFFEEKVLISLKSTWFSGPKHMNKNEGALAIYLAISCLFVLGIKMHEF